MKKLIYALILPLVVVSGLVFANQELNNEASKDSTLKPPAAAETKTEREKWEATHDGIKFKKWEASDAGKKVYAAEEKIRKQINALNPMEAVVTSLSLPPGSRLGFGVMVKINGENYILGYGPEESTEMQQLHNLKVDDRIIIKSHAVSHAPKYSYPIVSINYIERDGKVIFKRIPRKDGC